MGVAQIFITSGTTQAKPSDWTEAGHVVEMIGPGGDGGAGSVGATTGKGGAGGGGGGYMKLTYSSGTTGANFTYSVGLHCTSTTVPNPTCWQNTTTANAHVANSGLAGAAGGTVTAGAKGIAAVNGTPVPVTYTITVSSNGAPGGIGNTAVSLMGGAGGGGAGGPNGLGAAGGPSANVARFGGGGGGGSNGGTAGLVAPSATGGLGGNGHSSSGGGAGSTSNSTNGTSSAANSGGGGGGGFGNAISTSLGGAGSIDNTVWGSATNGCGGGGGGGGASNVNATVTGSGGPGGFAGGGGGGGGGARGGSSTCVGGVGGNGLIVVTYTIAPPAGAVTPPVLLLSANSSASATTNSFQTANFTTVSNTLIVTIVGIATLSTGNCAWTNTDAAAIAFTTSGLDWTTRMGYCSNGTTASDRTMIAMGTANVTSGSASTNVAVHFSNTNMGASGTKYAIGVFSCNNVNWTTPMGATGANAGLASNGAATVTLSGTPLISSCVFGARVAQYTGSGGGANAAVNWTEFFDLILSGGEIGLQAQYQLTDVSTSVSWQQTVLGDSIFNQNENIIGFELIASASTRRKFIIIS